MSNDISVQVRGFLGTTPVVRYGSDGGRAWAQFRLASTPSHRDAQGEWRDGETVWLTVKTFGALAENVSRSLRKSDPVIVTGRLRSESWTAEDGVERTSLTIVADMVGNDLSLGTANFSRAVYSAREGVSQAGAVEASAAETSTDETSAQASAEADPAEGGGTTLREAGQSDEVDAQFATAGNGRT